MIQALVFDLDGTLTNTERLHFKAWKQALMLNGVEGFTLEIDFVKLRIPTHLPSSGISYRLRVGPMATTSPV